MKTILTAFLIFTFLFMAIAQDDYQITLADYTTEDDYIALGNLFLDEGDKISYLHYPIGTPFTNYFFIGRLVEAGNPIVPTKKLSIPEDSYVVFVANSKVKNGRYIMPLFGGSDDYQFAYFDVNNNEGWIKGHESHLSLPQVELDEDFIYIISRDFFFKIDSLGNNVISRGVNFTFSNWRYLPYDLHFNSENELFLLGLLDMFEPSAFLSKINTETGEPIKTARFTDSTVRYLNFKIDDQNNMYLIGYTDNTLSNNEKNCVVTKLDADFNEIWTKIIHGPYFEYERSSINIMGNGNVAIGYSTQGAFPLVLLVLDENGEPLYQRGYPFYQPEVVTLSDGSIAMGSHYHFRDDGSIYPKLIFAKTDTEGFLPDCVDFETCLTVETSSAPMEFITGFTSDLDTLRHHELEYKDTFDLVAPFCDVPDAPSPEFLLPDTVCVNTTVTTDGVYNHFAHGIEWRLTGLNTDSLLTDSTHFVYQFEEPGEYVLCQTIYFLGCGYFYEKTITVLPVLTMNFVVSDTICDENFVLKPISNRPLRGFEWNDGSEQSELLVNESGWYYLRATDGYCEVEDSIEVRFLKDLIPDYDQPFRLPADTLMCVAHLPHFIKPTSNYGNEFWINGTAYRDSLLVSSAGLHDIEFFIGDCAFYAAYELITDPCPALVYFPNVFSPNNDGINDLFFPQGDNFIAQKLRIFDRWGSLLFEDSGTDVRWTGRHNGQSLENGVYVYQFAFQNLLTGEKEEISGSVSLLR